MPATPSNGADAAVHPSNTTTNTAPTWMPKARYFNAHPFDEPQYLHAADSQGGELEDDYNDLRQRNANVVLEECMSPFPSLEEMETNIQASTVERTRKLREERDKNLDVLQSYAEQDLAELRRAQWLAYAEELSDTATERQIRERFHVETLIHSYTHDDFRARVEHAYQRAFLEFWKYTPTPSNRNQAEVSPLPPILDQAAKHGQHFPASMDDFTSLTSRGLDDVQIRVAQFLVADDETKRQLLTMHPTWTTDETEPLSKLYEKDPRVRGQVQKVAQKNLSSDD